MMNREASNVPNIFEEMFDFPRIDYELTGSHNDAELVQRVVYKWVDPRNFDFLPSFATEFVRGLNRSRGGWQSKLHADFHQALNELLSADQRLRQTLRHTVFVSMVWLDYSRMAYIAFSTYSRGMPVELHMPHLFLSPALLRSIEA